MLIAKNEAYGDSALKPAKIFARGSAIDNLCSRIDDKLMRIKNGGINELTEDTITDLIGYLILLKIAIVITTNKKHLRPTSFSKTLNKGSPLWYVPRGCVSKT